MGNFEDTIARMKQLYTYGMVKEENNKQNNHTLEYTKKGADGKYYGIVKEFNQYYIKQTSEGKQNLAESYDYIGGYMNKKAYQYDSYNNALKNLELKLSSLNEAYENKVNITTLDPFKKEIVLAEASDKMKDSIARQRQIMYNSAMIMNESTDYAVKGGAACSTSQPEAETGSKGDKAEGSKDATADPDYKGSHVGLDKKATPFEKEPVKSKDLNESLATDTDFDAGMNKGEEPASIGWDMENQEKVNEDSNVCPDCGKEGAACTCKKEVNEEGEREWGSEGLPSQEGVGSPDGHLMEDDEPEIDDTDTFDDDDVDSEFEGDYDDEELDGDDESMEEPIDGEEPEIGDEEEESLDFDDDEEEETEPIDETDPEAVQAEIERLQSVLAGLESGEEAVEEPESMEDPMEEPMGDVDDSESDFNEDVPEEPVDAEEEDMEEPMFDESKKKAMNTIIESVVRQFVNEDELHVFGDHPGYRKKPMTLPPTGEDKNEHGEDINDDSVHNEEPFGKQIGDSSPFKQLVDKVAADIKYQLKHGVPLDNKKKVD